MNSVNALTFIVFILLQICVADRSIIDLKTFGVTPSSLGVATAKAKGDDVEGAAQVIAGPHFVKSTAIASASSDKHCKKGKKHCH